jgi:hypothetical protein
MVLPLMILMGVRIEKQKIDFFTFKMHVDNYAVVGSGHSCGGFSDLGGGSGNAWWVL